MTVEIPLNSKKYPGLVALLDEEDYQVVAGLRWHPFVDGKSIYATAHILGTGAKVRMHRLILPGVPLVDHIDHDGLNNTRSNLRPVTRRLNLANQRPVRGGSSQFKGVSWDKCNRRWRATVRVNGTINHLGRYDNEREAAMAYDAAASEAYGEFACLNFPGHSHG